MEGTEKWKRQLNGKDRKMEAAVKWKGKLDVKQLLNGRRQLRMYS